TRSYGDWSSDVCSSDLGMRPRTDEVSGVRRWLAALGAVIGAIAVAVPCAQASSTCPAPRCMDVAIPLPTGVHVTDNHVRVLLPKIGRASCRERVEVRGA